MACRKLSIDLERSQIAEWFTGKSVFITGASGFMGKVLLEKLLSACPEVGSLYLLVRQKKDIAPEKRLDQLKQVPIFDKLRKNHPERLDKLVAITGDISLPDLGLSAADITRLSQVSVVFHTAATVRFDDSMKKSVSMNIVATQRLLNICQQWSQIESFVHVSTCYCNCDQPTLEEKVYPPPTDLKQLIAACDCLDSELLENITSKMLGNRPNTYTFTKAMGEQVVAENSGIFPIAIFRPSIVTATMECPIPGWVDNLNGPTGIIAGAGKGLVRSLYCGRHLTADLVPVDIAINCMIAVAWNTAVEKSKVVKVYNCASGLENPIKWYQIEEWGQKFIVKHPLDDAFWYPGGSFKGNRFLHTMSLFLFQYLPAYLFDYSVWLFGKKTNFSLVRLQERMCSAFRSLEFFTTHEWTFHNDNVKRLRSKLTNADRQLFDFDVNRIKWEPYLEQYVKGTRKYVLKEKDEDIPRAKSHMMRLTLLHRGVKLAVFVLIVRAIFLRSDTARILLASGYYAIRKGAFKLYELARDYII